MAKSDTGYTGKQYKDRVKDSYPQAKHVPTTTGKQKMEIEHNVVAGAGMNAGANNPNAEARRRAKESPGNNGQ